VYQRDAADVAKGRQKLADGVLSGIIREVTCEE
jgi:hypothetical protein